MACGKAPPGAECVPAADFASPACRDELALIVCVFRSSTSRLAERGSNIIAPERRPPLILVSALPQCSLRRLSAATCGTKPCVARKLSSAKRGGPFLEPPAAPPGDNFCSTAVVSEVSAKVCPTQTPQMRCGDGLPCTLPFLRRVCPNHMPSGVFLSRYLAHTLAKLATRLAMCYMTGE